MARYHGKIGYGVNTETYPGVWEEQITEREYYGDVIKNKVSVQQSSNVNPTISLSNSISIISDSYAYDNLYAMRYVTFLNKKWNITNIEVDRPRIVLSIGGLYNEQPS